MKLYDITNPAKLDFCLIFSQLKINLFLIKTKAKVSNKISPIFGF
jgi:hypothetical protein